MKILCIELDLLDIGKRFNSHGITDLMTRDKRTDFNWSDEAGSDSEGEHKNLFRSIRSRAATSCRTGTPSTTSSSSRTLTSPS